MPIPDLTRLQNLEGEAKRLVAGIRQGSMGSTAYDTAWVARVVEPDGRPSFPSAIAWLRQHQHPDGSWGGTVALPHDRVISTLAAIAALVNSPEDSRRVAAGCESLDRWCEEVENHPAETVAFELLAPTLVEHCRRLGLPIPYQKLAFVDALRQDKLRRIPPSYVYHPASPLAFSLEHLGDEVDIGRLDAARGANGSYGNSPSATAYVLLRKNDPLARAYLEKLARESSDGGFCNVQPFDVFEHAWVLFNLLAGDLVGEWCSPLVDFLASQWQEGGIGWNSAGIVADCDDTAVGIKVLRAFGKQPDANSLRRFASTDHFVCYFGERTTCASANIHALDAVLSSPDLADKDELASVALGYLRATRTSEGFWIDKWHSSPYYAVSHALIALSAHHEESDISRQWLIRTQHPNGSWGYSGGTIEETAYALQGLLAAAPDSQTLEAASKAVAYLGERFDVIDYPPLWIGKGLYTPQLVVRSAVLGALANAARVLGPRLEG